MDPEIVIALYRPLEGRDEELRTLIREHMPTLRRLGLVTDRPSILCRAADGTWLEIFEWASRDSSRKAHEHAESARIWEEMGRVATFPALCDLAEADGRFPHFAPVNVEGV